MKDTFLNQQIDDTSQSKKNSDFLSEKVMSFLDMKTLRYTAYDVSKHWREISREAIKKHYLNATQAIFANDFVKSIFVEDEVILVVS